MYFLIDYENVRNMGMQGTELLLPSDDVMIFYSKSCAGMEQRYLDDIQKSGCGLTVCELLEKRKNGIDFYIATKLGELFGAERCKNAVIVSNDSGFQAVRDFWQERSGTKHRVALSGSIEYGIIAAGEVSERANALRAGRKMTDIGRFYAAYQERCRLRQALADAFRETPYSERLEEIQEIIQTESSLKVIYLSALRHFGRQDGRAIYRKLKTCIGV